MKGEGPYTDFADEVGVVTGSPEGLIDVKLLSRALLFSVPPSSLVRFLPLLLFGYDVVGKPFFFAGCLSVS